MQAGSTTVMEMVDVGLFGRRQHTPAPSPEERRAKSVQSVLSRLDAVVDRLEGVYAQIAPLLPEQPHQPSQTGDTDD